MHILVLLRPLNEATPPERSGTPLLSASSTLRIGIVVRVRAGPRVRAVAFAQDPLPVADPFIVRDVGAVDHPWRRNSYRGVATEVVDVGVGDQPIVEVGRVEP